LFEFGCQFITIPPQNLYPSLGQTAIYTFYGRNISEEGYLFLIINDELFRQCQGFIQLFFSKIEKQAEFVQKILFFQCRIVIGKDNECRQIQYESFQQKIGFYVICKIFEPCAVFKSVLSDFSVKIREISRR